MVALEMGRGVPPALSKPDPIAIFLMDQNRHTPCPNFEIYTEFKLPVIGLWCQYYQFTSCFNSFLSSLIFL